MTTSAPTVRIEEDAGVPRQQRQGAAEGAQAEPEDGGHPEALLAHLECQEVVQVVGGVGQVVAEVDGRPDEDEQGQRAAAQEARQRRPERPRWSGPPVPGGRRRTPRGAGQEEHDLAHRDDALDQVALLEGADDARRA